MAVFVLLECIGSAQAEIKKAVSYIPEGIVTGGNLSVDGQAKMERFKPAFPFEAKTPPPAPDYWSADAWAALPERQDDADVAPPNTKYPEAQKSAQVDVFFIHPTGTESAQFWNAPIDDPGAVEALSLVMKYCASVFNAAGRVYVPRYRQATLYSFFDGKTTSGIQAIDLAYGDVERAFLHYLTYYNQGRPFILAGHSQGSCHGMRLLQEEILGTPLDRRLVGAYLVGYAIPSDVLYFPGSRFVGSSYILTSWNSYTADGNPDFFTNSAVIWLKGSYQKVGGLPIIQVNPLSWKLNGEAVLAAQNPGSLPFDAENKTGVPALVPGVTGADASGKVLIITKPQVPGFESADGLPILSTKVGDYHSFDYVFFYESIRKNAVERVNEFFKKYKAAGQ
jgi:hypothetical protein